MDNRYIYCMVSLDGHYDYENQSTTCNDTDTLMFWVQCGINKVVVLDAFSMELLMTLSDSNQIEEYVWDSTP